MVGGRVGILTFILNQTHYTKMNATFQAVLPSEKEPPVHIA